MHGTDVFTLKNMELNIGTAVTQNRAGKYAMSYYSCETTKNVKLKDKIEPLSEGHMQKHTVIVPSSLNTF